MRIPVDWDVQTAVRYMRITMEARGFMRYRIIFHGSEGVFTTTARRQT